MAESSARTDWPGGPGLLNDVGGVGVGELGDRVDDGVLRPAAPRPRNVAVSLSGAAAGGPPPPNVGRDVPATKGLDRHAGIHCRPRVAPTPDKPTFAWLLLAPHHPCKPSCGEGT